MFNNVIKEKLSLHQKRLKMVSLRQLFELNPRRFDEMCFLLEDMAIDFSKNCIDQSALNDLLLLATDTGLASALKKLSTGDLVNFSEKRAATHLLLRHQLAEQLPTEQTEPVNRMLTWAELIREKHWLGANNQTITDLVVLGIGGSRWGAQLVVTALSNYCQKDLTCHFVSSLDPLAFEELLKQLDPYRTLFVIATKSFTTIETLSNAAVAKKWWLNVVKNSNDLNKHFIAITEDREKAALWGIDPENILWVPESIGGRFSVWSAMGFPAAVMLGKKHFLDFIQGGHEYDNYCLNTGFAKNAAVIHALLTIWYVNFWHTHSNAILAYDFRLFWLPNYLQQLIMESNGKNFDQYAKPINYATAAAIWGSHGPDAQHTFFQHLLQSQEMIPIDFIVTAKTPAHEKQQHDLMFKNYLAQSQALAFGCELDEVKNFIGNKYSNEAEMLQAAAYRVVSGNKPHTSILINELSPKTLGKLLAHYEMKTYIESILWGLNCFDQPGVELGKTILKQLQSEQREPHISVTGLMKIYRQFKE